MKINSETINGETIDIEVDSDGRFTAQYEEVTYHADSKAELIEELRKAVNKVKASKTVLVTLLDTVMYRGQILGPHTMAQRGEYITGRGLLHCVLRGIHPRTGALLLADPNGKKFQLDGYRFKKNVARMLTPAEEAEYARLTAALDTATAAYDTFRASVLIDPKAATS